MEETFHRHFYIQGKIVGRRPTITWAEQATRNNKLRPTSTKQTTPTRGAIFSHQNGNHHLIYKLDFSKSL
jgi:hypothetical protein